MAGGRGVCLLPGHEKEQRLRLLARAVKRVGFLQHGSEPSSLVLPETKVRISMIHSKDCCLIFASEFRNSMIHSNDCCSIAASDSMLAYKKLERAQRSCKQVPPAFFFSGGQPWQTRKWPLGSRRWSLLPLNDPVLELVRRLRVQSEYCKQQQKQCFH